MKTSPQDAAVIIEAFERVGLLPALIEVAALLDGHGREKHGTRGWRDLDESEQKNKILGHLNARTGRDSQSGRLSAAHAAARCLMLTALSLEGERQHFAELVRARKTMLDEKTHRVSPSESVALTIFERETILDEKTYRVAQLEAHIAELERELEIAKAAAGPRGVPPLPTEADGTGKGQLL